MIKKFLRSPLATLVLFALGAGLLLYGGIGGIRAAPRIQSEYFGGQVQMTEIHTAIAEGGTIVEGEDTLMGEHFFAQNDDLNGAEGFKLGVVYNEELNVVNVGTSDSSIPEYVRVTVYCYWVDAQGQKLANLDPGLIKLTFDTSDGWTIDNAASNYNPKADPGTSGERTVLYYADILDKGEESTPFTKTISIDPSVLAKKGSDGKNPYDGATFKIKAVVDAVQTHNADAARKGAWGQITANG